MIRKIIYTSITIAFLLGLVAGPVGAGVALAEDLPVQLPGVVEGVGTQFEVRDSAYLNVSLVSSERVSVYLSSIPSVLELRVEAADAALSTDLTLSGLVPGLEYHLYTDDLHNHTIMSADAAGSLAWTLDLVDPHLIFIQTTPSTINIYADGSGCGTDVGVWDDAKKTCTLTTDLSDTIQINGSGITLDGNGHTLSGPSTKSHGVYIPGIWQGKTKVAYKNVTIKNLTIIGFPNGIYLGNAQDCEIRGNTIKDVENGLTAWPHNQNYGGGNLFTGNQILANSVGITNQVVGNSFQRNSVSSSYVALDGNVLGTFYNNNLISYQYPFHSTNNTPILSAEDPFYGNYWSTFDSSFDGCEDLDGDRRCDTAYVPMTATPNTTAGQDLSPWTEPDGWLAIDISAPFLPIMFDPDGVTVEVSATFVDEDVNATHAALEWDWGDGETSTAQVASEAGGQGKVEPTQHAYDETGVYEIKLTMKDEPYLSTVVKSYKYVVIYDPSAGFVTGGGSIFSPLGAYVLDPTMTGQATFGFISKFIRNGKELVLSGNTVFEFHAADFRFTSSSYDFLVVKDNTNQKAAMYHGEGYINGDETKDYSFMLTAQDLVDEYGNPADRFRIQIWDADTNGLVYDNKTGYDPTAMDDDAGTVINDGSIIIQTNSK